MTVRATHHGFLSYSRRDGAFAAALIARLEAANRSIAYDREDIHDGEAWRRKLATLVGGAQNVIVLISRGSLASRECQWELDLAVRLNKRLVTVRVDDVSPGELPPPLAAVQWIDATTEAEIDRVAARILAAFDTDQEWAERHTQLTLHTQQWRERGTLLRGRDLRDAETTITRFAGKRPAPTADQMALLLASRRAARRRARIALAVGLAVLATIGTLGFNALAARRNARFVELRRQGESALNVLAGGDAASAVAALDYVTREDHAGALPEYRTVLRFWRTQMRSYDDLGREARVGDLIDWRGRLHVKTGHTVIQPLGRNAPVKVAPTKDGQDLIVADYSGVALLRLPGLKQRLKLGFKGRVLPLAIHRLAGTDWLLAVGSRLVVENEEDEPTRTESCLTLVMPQGGASPSPTTPAVPDVGASPQEAIGVPAQENTPVIASASDGARAVGDCTLRRFTLAAATVDGPGRVRLDGVMQGGDESPDYAARLLLDARTGALTSETVEAATALRSQGRIGGLPDDASAVHTFPQQHPERRAWREQSQEWVERWRAKAGNDKWPVEAATDFSGLDPTTLQDPSIFNQMADGYASGTFSAAGVRYVWGEYVSGNSYASVGVCRLAANTRTVEWCRSIDFLTIAGRATARSPDETWQARANGESSVAPLDLFELVSVKRTTIDELPNLVSAMAFAPSSSSLAILTEANELWVYELVRGGPARRVHRITLGGAAAPFCPAGAEGAAPAPPSGLGFASDSVIVGLGIDGQLFAIDATTGGITWRRTFDTGAVTCPDRVEVTARGGFFIVHGRSFARLFHAPTGVALGAPVTSRALTGVAVDDAWIGNLGVTDAGDAVMDVRGRLFVREHGRASDAATGDLERLTGISRTDGRTPIPNPPTFRGIAATASSTAGIREPK